MVCESWSWILTYSVGFFVSVYASGYGFSKSKPLLEIFFFIVNFHGYRASHKSSKYRFLMVFGSQNETGGLPYTIYSSFVLYLSCTTCTGKTHFLDIHWLCSHLRKYYTLEEKCCQSMNLGQHLGNFAQKVTVIGTFPLSNCNFLFNCPR